MLDPQLHFPHQYFLQCLTLNASQRQTPQAPKPPKKNIGVPWVRQTPRFQDVELKRQRVPLYTIRELASFALEGLKAWDLVQPHITSAALRTAAATIASDEEWATFIRALCSSQQHPRGETSV